MLFRCQGSPPSAGPSRSGKAVAKAARRLHHVHDEVQLQAGGALRSAPHFAGTREFLTVERGQVRVESGGDAEVLTPGDSASYRADVPHLIVNTGKTVATIFLVDIYR